MLRSAGYFYVKRPYETILEAARGRTGEHCVLQLHVDGGLVTS